jgi:hypothetical protein
LFVRRRFFASLNEEHAMEPAWAARELRERGTFEDTTASPKEDDLGKWRWKRFGRLGLYTFVMEL